jgi:pseudouridine-5'-phosphate glycosidase
MLNFHPDVAFAIQARLPVVALESTIIAHGLPWPMNMETAVAAEEAIRGVGAVPATIAVINGVPTIGLTRQEIETLAKRSDVLKASRRDLAAAMVTGRTASTTVAATMYLAHRAKISVFATGGIGGVHRGVEATFDISADLIELSRTPVAVVCSGAKSILDVPKTLELQETLGVPVVGYGTDHFPAFFVRSSGLPVSVRIDSPADVAKFLRVHWEMGGGGALIVQPVPESAALAADEFDKALVEAKRRIGNIRGSAVTPALLKALAEVTGGKSLQANRELVIENARLAARIAMAG